MLAPFAISVLIYDQDALLARRSSARALLEQQFEAALVNLPRVPPRLRKEPLQALRFPSLGSDHRLGVRKGGEGLVAFGGQQEPLKIASETFTLGASVKEIVKACCVLFQRTGSGLYGQSSGHGGISSLCATIGAQRFSYFNKVPIGYRKREAPQGGDGQKAVVSWQVLPMIYRGVGCLSVGAGRQRRRLGLRPPCVEYLGTLGGKSLWGQKAGDASTLADDVPSCGEPWCSPVSLSMLGWPIGRMEPAGRYCLASLYCGGRDTRLHVQGERQLGVQYGLRFLSWARCFGPTVRLARVGRAVRGGRSIGRRELACKGGELSGAPLYPNPTGTNCWSGA